MVLNLFYLLYMTLGKYAHVLLQTQQNVHRIGNSNFRVSSSCSLAKQNVPIYHFLFAVVMTL